jgi:peptide deformylase
VGLLRIRITGEPVLHQVADEVREITPEITELVADMYETMDKAPGVGLAAPQIGVGLRIFVFSWEDQDVSYRGVAINPELTVSPYDPADCDPELDMEGCLSIPGERFPLARSQAATLIATDVEGQQYTIEATGWLARIFQHEYDHLNGMLYADRLQKPYKKQMKKAIKASGWGEPGFSWLPGQDYLEP